LWHAQLVMLNVEYIQVSTIFLSQHLQQCSVCVLGEILFTSKFSYLLFCNSALKTETTTRCRTTNSKQLGPIIMITTDQQSNHMFFFAGAKRWCAFYQPMADWSIMLSQNHFPEPKRHILTFLHSILLCRIANSAQLEML
jgi:hypothetical protein